LVFVGGLIPIKGCDLALRAAASLLQKGLARFTIVGDGPERRSLEQLARSLGIEEVVSFCGWLIHSEALKRMRAADVLVFPSIRDFGGAVVFEAMAMGAVPVVVDFGGPGDIVQPGVGYKVSLTNESDVVRQIEKVLVNLERDRELLDWLRQECKRHARERLTWEGKAEIMTQILTWSMGRGPKPDLRPPKTKCLQERQAGFEARVRRG
jgi:glycosyltransferase involved in cell wall biosynthesis